jgi:transposase
LPVTKRKELRSLMHDFRRRPEDLTPERLGALEDLFEKVPLLGAVHALRWQATAIFDTAADRASAAAALRAWMAEARESEMDWEPFIGMLERHWDGILAYFDERRSSGPVEGLNAKIRVVMRRGYGIRNLSTLWSRVLLDVNWAWKAVGRTIVAVRDLASRIRAHFAMCYT